MEGIKPSTHGPKPRMLSLHHTELIVNALLRMRIIKHSRGNFFPTRNYPVAECFIINRFFYLQEDNPSLPPPVQLTIFIVFSYGPRFQNTYC